MEEETFNESTLNRPLGGRILDAPLVSIDLPQRIAQLKTEPAWEKSDRNAITVYKAKQLRIVLIAMHAGAEMIPQISDAIISIHVLEGMIQFRTEDETFKVGKGQILNIHPLVTHNITALEETVFLLYMTDEVFGNIFE